MAWLPTFASNRRHGEQPFRRTYSNKTQQLNMQPLHTIQQTQAKENRTEHRSRHYVHEVLAAEGLSWFEREAIHEDHVAILLKLRRRFEISRGNPLAHPVEGSKKTRSNNHGSDSNSSTATESSFPKRSRSFTEEMPTFRTGVIPHRMSVLSRLAFGSSASMVLRLRVGGGSFCRPSLSSSASMKTAV